MKLRKTHLIPALILLGSLSQLALAGVTGSSLPGQTSVDDHTLCNSGCTCQSSPRGMVQYRVHSMRVSLNLYDTPVGYTPPKGPAVPITLS